MKLIIFTASFPFGKKETYLENEIKYLSRLYEKITICPLYYNAGSMVSRSLPSNVEVIVPPIPRGIIKRVLLFLVGFIFNPSAAYIYIKDFTVNKNYKNYKRFVIDFVDYMIVANSWQKKELFNRRNCDVYFYWAVGWAYAMAYQAKNKENRYICRVHGGDVFLERSNGYIPVRFILKKFDIILSVSNLAGNYVAQHFNIDINNIYISRLATEDNGSGVGVVDDGEINVLSVSSVDSIKRVNLILEELLAVTKYKVRWVHFGDGPMLSKIKEVINIESKQNVFVILKGWVDYSLISEFYKTNRVDIFINLSKYEGLPVSVVEAMSFGVPIIATDVGATAEIVSEDNGFLVTENFGRGEIASLINNFSVEDLRKKGFSSRVKWEAMYNSNVVYNKLLEFLKKGNL